MQVAFQELYLKTDPSNILKNLFKPNSQPSPWGFIEMHFSVPLDHLISSCWSFVLGKAHLPCAIPVPPKQPGDLWGQGKSKLLIQEWSLEHLNHWSLKQPEFAFLKPLYTCFFLFVFNAENYCLNYQQFLYIGRTKRMIKINNDSCVIWAMTSCCK